MTDEKEKKVREGRRITITIPDKTYMDLLLKLRHENISWKRFFNFIIEGYIKDDMGITDYLDHKMAEIRAKSRTKNLDKERKMVQNTKDIFGLDENEIQDIYNIIEEEVEP